LVAGLSGDAELPAQIGHALALQAAGDETQALLRSRTLLPGHRHLPPAARRKVLPMCPVRSVTYVSGRSQEARERPLFACRSHGLRPRVVPFSAAMSARSWRRWATRRS